MADIVRTKEVSLNATLTQHGEAYQMCGSSYREPKKPAGKYICMECGDASITFHTPQDEFKTKCPKCNSLMTRIAKPMSVG